MATPATADNVTLQIKGDNSTIEVLAKAGKTYDGEIVATLSNSTTNTSLTLTIPSVKIAYPAEANYKLVDNVNTWNTKDAVLIPTFEGNPITTIKAIRNLTELFSNYADIKKYIVTDGDPSTTDRGGTIKFTLKEAVTGVSIADADAGIIEVLKNYDGKPITAVVKVSCGSKVLFTREIPVTIPVDGINGTFGYAAVTEPAVQGVLNVDVASETTRMAAVDLTDALVWKDATAAKNEIWPDCVTSVYGSNTAMDKYGFTVTYAFVGDENVGDNANFKLDAVNGTLTMKEEVAKYSQYLNPMEVKVTVTPNSPWGAVKEAKVVTVKVATW